MPDTLPLSAKFVLRELEHADEPLSRRELADRADIPYTTVCDGIETLRHADLIIPAQLHACPTVFTPTDPPLRDS